MMMAKWLGSRKSNRMKALVVASCLSFLFVTGCDGRKGERGVEGKKSLKGKGYVSILDLSGGTPEGPLSSGLFSSAEGQTFVDLIRTLAIVEKDKKSKSIFIRLRGQRFPFAQAKELGERLARIRAKKIVVTCHTHEVDNSTLWLLSRGCDDLWVSAAGAVPTVGIGAELSYLKGAFDKVGIVADMLAMGKYKSGGEALTRTGPSEASLGNLKETLSDLREQWLSGISEGREDVEARKKSVEDGPWSPKEALSLKLINHIGFEDQALNAARSIAKTERTKIVFGDGASSESDSPAAEIIRVLVGAKQREGHRDRIVVVPAVGAITMSATGPFDSGSGITASAMTRTLRRLRKDESVRAVVMRMDSPGGSPLASDLIWREMMLMREEKPIIVSIGGMSASGGYYIASGATKIVSSSTAIVGSIGVFGGKIVLGGALGKMGVTHYQVAASPEEGAAARATHMSPMSPWDDATRERVRATMRRIYDLFVERVAEGRGMPKDKVYATAEGEIYLATTGKERGLIDELGGVEKALSVARKEANLPDNIAVVVEGGAESMLEALFLGPEPDAEQVEQALERFEERRLQTAAKWAFGGAAKDLKPFAAAISPMIAGETVVAALPFALEIR